MIGLHRDCTFSLGLFTSFKVSVKIVPPVFTHFNSSNTAEWLEMKFDIS
jgi:hypothetical protein